VTPVGGAALRPPALRKGNRAREPGFVDRRALPRLRQAAADAPQAMASLAAAALPWGTFGTVHARHRFVRVKDHHIAPARHGDQDFAITVRADVKARRLPARRPAPRAPLWGFGDRHLGLVAPVDRLAWPTRGPADSFEGCAAAFLGDPPSITLTGGPTVRTRARTHAAQPHQQLWWPALATFAARPPTSGDFVGHTGILRSVFPDSPAASQQAVSGWPAQKPKHPPAPPPCRWRPPTQGPSPVPGRATARAT
jgi:hypothetical protein